MKKPVVIVGIGQMGGIFAKGFLKAGYPVYPVVSGMSIESSARQMPECDFVLLAVPENKLHAVIQRVPNQWKSKLGLLQNELLPRDWQAESIKTVTAMAVWFEKKKGERVTVFQPTPVFGPHAETVKDALHEVDIPCKVLSSADELLIELVKKNVYVLTINIAGLEKGGTTGELLNHHLDFAKDIAGEVIGIQEWLAKTRFDRDELISSMILMLEKVPEHKCRGRVAQERFDRTIAYAAEAGIGTPVLNGIAEWISHT